MKDLFASSPGGVAPATSPPLEPDDTRPRGTQMDGPTGGDVSSSMVSRGAAGAGIQSPALQALFAAYPPLEAEVPQQIVDALDSAYSALSNEEWGKTLQFASVPQSLAPQFGELTLAPPEIGLRHVASWIDDLRTRSQPKPAKELKPKELNLPLDEPTPDTSMPRILTLVPTAETEQTVRARIPEGTIDLSCGPVLVRIVPESQFESVVMQSKYQGASGHMLIRIVSDPAAFASRLSILHRPAVPNNQKNGHKTSNDGGDSDAIGSVQRSGIDSALAVAASSAQCVVNEARIRVDYLFSGATLFVVDPAGLSRGEWKFLCDEAKDGILSNTFIVLTQPRRHRRPLRLAVLGSATGWENFAPVVGSEGIAESNGATDVDTLQAYAMRARSHSALSELVWHIPDVLEQMPELFTSQVYGEHFVQQYAELCAEVVQYDVRDVADRASVQQVLTQELFRYEEWVTCVGEEPFRDAFGIDSVQTVWRKVQS